MNQKLRVILLAVITCGICLAQANQPAVGNNWKPATTNQIGSQYPMVNSEGPRHPLAYMLPMQRVFNSISMASNFQ